MDMKKGFQNLGTFLAVGVVLCVISRSVLGILHLVLQLAFTVALIWLAYKGVLFVIDGFKNETQ